MRPAPVTRPSRLELLVFDTHPIQYRSPVFRALYRRCPEMKVCLLDESYHESVLPQQERGKIPSQTWGLPLLEGFPVEILGANALGWRKFSKAVFERLTGENRPRAVLLYGYYLPEHWIIRWCCARAGVPLLFVGDTFVENTHGPARFVKRPLQRWFFSGIDRFISVGTKNSAHYRAKGIGADRIVEAKHCVDESFFHAEPGARERWRERHGLPSGARIVLFAGRLYGTKRPRDVVEIHRRLSDDSSVHTVIIGNGELETELRAQSAGMARIQFLGFQNQGEIREAYCGADVLLLTSEHETWGLVVNEAMSCGLPAIVTETCGAADDLVVRGETGEVFQVGDVKTAAGAIRSLFADPKRLSRMGARAREKVTREYGVGQFADAILRAVNSAQ